MFRLVATTAAMSFSASISPPRPPPQSDGRRFARSFTMCRDNPPVEVRVLPFFGDAKAVDRRLETTAAASSASAKRGFDMWHGAGKWDSEEKADIIDKCVDKTRARQDASKGRVSMELRFRARCKPNQKNGVPFSPVSSAYRGKVFTPDTVRPSEGRYDLVTGTVAVK